ncbi:hypothetical protein ACM66B_000230 [Microbotryomycetes sp. NB124-2]
MQVYSLLVYDRHTTCCFYQHVAGPLPEPGPSTLPNVHPAAALAPALTRAADSQQQQQQQQQQRARLPAEAPWASEPQAPLEADVDAARHANSDKNSLAFDENAKLIYGIVFSLRNMAKKLGGRDEDSDFRSYTTSTYKLHYLHTPTSYHFVLLTSPTSESMRPLLRQIYVGPFLDHVIRNPLVDLDSLDGVGIANAAFRNSVDKILSAVRM